MHRVVLEHVCHVIYLNEVVNSYNFDVVSKKRCSEYKTTDSTKTVNTYFNHYAFYLVYEISFP